MSPAPAPLVADVVTTHLFGLCRNLGLVENARALALAIGARREIDETGDLPRYQLDSLRQASGAAAEEIQLSRDERRLEAEQRPIRRFLATDAGEVEVEVEPTTVQLIERLQEPMHSEQAAEMVQSLGESIRAPRLTASMGSDNPYVSHSLSGVTLRVPRRLDEGR